jgi:hypothetical protein
MANWQAGAQALGQGLQVIATRVGEREMQQAMQEREMNLEALRNQRQLEAEGRAETRQLGTEQREADRNFRQEGRRNAREDAVRKEEQTVRAGERASDRAWQRERDDATTARQTQRDVQAARRGMASALQRYDQQINDLLKNASAAEGRDISLAVLDAEATESPSLASIKARVDEIRAEKKRYHDAEMTNLISLGDESIPQHDEVPGNKPMASGAPAKPATSAKPAPATGAKPVPGNKPPRALIEEPSASGFDAADANAERRVSESANRQQRYNDRQRAEKDRDAITQKKVREASDAKLKQWLDGPELSSTERIAARNELRRRAGKL